MEEKVVITREMCEGMLSDKEVEWNGIKFMVKPVISFEEAMMMIMLVVSRSFNNETEEFAPEILEMALDMFLVQLYTNIDLNEENDDYYEIINLPGLIETIKGNINMRQFNTIEHCIRARCRAKVRKQEAEHSKEIKELFDNLMKGMNGLEDIFKDVSPDDLAALTEIFGSGEINEENIVKAIMGANKTEDKQ